LDKSFCTTGFFKLDFFTKAIDLVRKRAILQIPIINIKKPDYEYIKILCES